MPGKVDWLAHNLPVEGERPEPPTAGRVMRDDVVRCRPADRTADVRELIERSPYPFALVTADDGTLLGRARPAPWTAPPDGRSARSWSSAPRRSARTVGREVAAAPRRPKDLRWTIVTTPEGRLLGVASREDLERAGGLDGVDEGP